MKGGLGSRSGALERLASTRTEPLDVLVVGGGITGAGIALDAAARGLRVGLVERFDFASGTSSKSSKLVHGGLRYLQHGEFGLVREASYERELLARLAPHLVEPLPFCIPAPGGWSRAKFGAALWAYDALASFKATGLHRYVGQDELERMMPALPKGKLRGGYVYYDSKTDDARLVVEVLIQAVRLGATVANYTAVRDLEGSQSGCEAFVEDTLGGDVFAIRARRIIVAAGVWSDRIEGMAGDAARPRLRPSKGVHIALRPGAVPVSGPAGFFPDAERKRLLFIVPWIESVIVGTTDTAYDGDLDRPTVEAHDRAYCLDALNATFDGELGPADVVGAWAGLRPLLRGTGLTGPLRRGGEAGPTVDLSRGHSVYDIAPGIIGITGGKLTTYRRMAEDAIGRMDWPGLPKSRTRRIKLGCSDLPALKRAVAGRSARAGLRAEVAGHLIRSYGDRALRVLDLACEEQLLEELAPEHLPVAAEALWCARAEMAVQLSDLLARRTRLALTDAGAGIEPGSAAPSLLAGELGWTGRETARQIESYRLEIAHERGAAPAAERAAV